MATEFTSRREIGVIFIDTECMLCDRFADFVATRDSKSIFLFASLQSEAARCHFGRRAVDLEQLSTIMFVNSKSTLFKSDAVLTILRQLDGPWFLLSILLFCPRVLRDRLYEFIARRRFFVGKFLGVCKYNKEVADRFIEPSLEEIDRIGR